MERYSIVEESLSGHCCFEYTVVDNEILREDGKPSWICETFEKEEAELICNALNK